MHKVGFEAKETAGAGAPGGQKPRKLKAFIVGVCLFAVGVGILFSGINNLTLARRAASWPTVVGTIVSSECVYYYIMSEGSSYFTHVKYGYAIAGTSYEGHRLAFGYKGSWWRRPNQKIADKLSSARKVLVRYDPDKPAMAVLSSGLNGSTAVTLFAGSWTLLVTAAIVLHYARPRRRGVSLSLTCGPNRFSFMTQGVGGIVLLAVLGLAIAWIGGLLSDWGVLSTLVTT